MNPPDIEFALKNIRSRNPIQQESGLNYLIAKFQPLIHKLSYAICPTCDIKDMIQSGNKGIMLAIRSYNGNSSFSTWVYSKVRHELQKEREIQFPVKISRYLLKKGNKATFTNKKDEGFYVDDPAKNIIQKENGEKLQESLRGINRMFPKIQVKIFTEYYFMDKKLNDLSKKYHTNAKYLISQMMEILRKNAHLL